MAEDEAQGARTKKVRGVIDRIEDGAMAVVLLGDEEEHSIDVPLALLPEGASGGDQLSVTFRLDADSRRKTAARTEAMRARLERLGEANAGKKDFKL